MNLNTPCKHCGESIRRLMIKAMREDAGAKVYPSSSHCEEGLEHDFEVVNETPDKPQGGRATGALAEAVERGNLH